MRSLPPFLHSPLLSSSFHAPNCRHLQGIYGLLLNDMWIIIPNIAGIVCSIMQVLLWCCYCRKTVTSPQQHHQPHHTTDTSSHIVPAMESKEFDTSCNKMIVVEIPPSKAN